jgi:transposase
MPIMLGIDVSKGTLAAALVDPATRHVTWEQEFPNTAAGIARLLQRAPANVPLVLEPTGRYGLAIVRQAVAERRTVLMAQPRRAHAFLSSLSPRAKTDRLDSRGLAVYGSCAVLAPYPVKSEAVDQLDQLLTARRGLSGAAMRLRQQQDELPYAAAALEPALVALKTQIALLDRQIADRTTAEGEAAFPAAAALDQVPGIGPVTAAALASCLTARSFPTSDAFVAYVGLDVRVRDSGKRRGQRALTKQGNAELRRLLYLCAQASLRRTESPFRTQYERERQKGLSTTAALNAVARKLARLSWSMVTKGTTYTADRVYTRPPRRTSDQEVGSLTP